MSSEALSVAHEKLQYNAVELAILVLARASSFGSLSSWSSMCAREYIFMAGKTWLYVKRGNLLIQISQQQQKKELWAASSHRQFW